MCIVFPSYFMQVLCRRENSHPWGGKLVFKPLLCWEGHFGSAAKKFEETFPLFPTQ